MGCWLFKSIRGFLKQWAATEQVFFIVLLRSSRQKGLLKTGSLRCQCPWLTQEFENVVKRHEIAKIVSENMEETKRSFQFSMVRRYDERLGHVRALENIETAFMAGWNNHENGSRSTTLGQSMLDHVDERYDNGTWEKRKRRLCLIFTMVKRHDGQRERVRYLERKLSIMKLMSKWCQRTCLLPHLCATRVRGEKKLVIPCHQMQM